MRRYLLAAAAVAAFMFSLGRLYADTVTIQGFSYVLGNGESINTDTDAVFDLTRSNAGTVQLTCSDDDATCALTVLPGGAAAMVVGGASTTTFTVTTDGTGTGEVVLPLQSIAGAEIVNDTIDGTELADTIALDADTAWTLGGGEQMTWNKTATDATADNGCVVNYTALDTTAGTTGQYAIYVNNVASTEGADALLVLDNSDADDNVLAAIQVDNPSRFTSHFTVGNAAMTIGSSVVDSITFTVDGTGNAELVLPAASVGEAELTRPGRGFFTICGDLVTISNGDPVYYGPSAVVAAGYGRTCDITQAGNAVEATADAPVFGAKAFGVSSMICLTPDIGATGTPVAFTLRTAAGATDPSVTCSVADNETDCVANTQTTTDIASGATVAIEADGSGGDVPTAQFHCTVNIVF